ncbi:Os10g0417250 [Oryza sativa Japonica Group]|uniref:Os10g0417250 protein n=1 Tax=Oryza sativa subsp. japonica TaxID=39947 RepID=A0A0P0XUL4_ORYSJ|nr:Os10g0417250 [Oryza sativa Japonica Group]
MISLSSTSSTASSFATTEMVASRRPDIGEPLSAPPPPPSASCNFLSLSSTSTIGNLSTSSPSAPPPPPQTAFRRLDQMGAAPRRVDPQPVATVAVVAGCGG